MTLVGFISLFSIVSVAFQKINGAVVTTTATTTTTTTATPSTENGTNAVVVDDVNLSLLSDKELQTFFDAKYKKLMGILDIWSGKQSLWENLQQKNRKRRSAAAATKLAVNAGRTLFNAIKHLVIHIKNNKPEKEYERKGYLKDAIRDFYRLKPYHVRKINKKKGDFVLVGKVGKYTVKVEKEHGDEPTLELYITNKNRRKILRRVTYKRPEPEDKKPVHKFTW